MAVQTPEQVKARLEKRIKKLKEENITMLIDMAKMRSTIAKMAEEEKRHKDIINRYYDMWSATKKRADLLEEKITRQDQLPVLTGNTLH